MVQIDPERLRFDRSPYHRPNHKYVCGRAASWRSPCARGPNPDGTCGGTSACTPTYNPRTGGWDCRRPAHAGGPCREGPLPDGRCCRRQPPCKPRLSLRVKRGRAARMTAAVVVAALAATFGVGGGGGGDGGGGAGAAGGAGPGAAVLGFTSQSPGPLSPKHAQFTGEGGCESCHAAHDAGADGWLAAAFSGGDMTESCTSCHSFGGPARAPHNFPGGGRAVAASRVGPEPERGCVACHGEHEGRDGELVEFSDAQCHSCHETVFNAFADGHPAFGEAWPYGRRTAINFDHVAHLAKHFEREGEQAPDGCIGCHQVDKAARAVPTAGFEDDCAACHGDDVAKNELVVFALPEVSAAQFMALDHDLIREVCGPVSDDPDAPYARALSNAGAAVEAGAFMGDFFPAYADELTPVQQWLLDSDAVMLSDLAADAEASAAFLRLIERMAESGRAPLVERLAGRLQASGLGGEGKARDLLAGLSSLDAQAAACALATNNFPPELEIAETGWAMNPDGALVYRARQHADPVMRGWLELAAEAAGGKPEDGDGDALAAAMREELLQLAGGGPGNCTKCHAVSDRDAAPDSPGEGDRLRVEWRSRGAEPRPYTTYDHGPHVDLLGPGARCADCHVRDPDAAYAANFEHTNPFDYQASFRAIEISQCTACHGREAGGQGLSGLLQDVSLQRSGAPAAGAGSVRADCQLCHEYHRDPGFETHQLLPAPPTDDGEPAAGASAAPGQEPRHASAAR